MYSVEEMTHTTCYLIVFRLELTRYKKIVHNSMGKGKFVCRWAIGNIKSLKVRGDGSVGEHLPCKHKELNLNSLNPHKQDKAVSLCTSVIAVRWRRRQENPRKL